MKKKEMFKKVRKYVRIGLRSESNEGVEVSRENVREVISFIRELEEEERSKMKEIEEERNSTEKFKMFYISMKIEDEERNILELREFEGSCIEYLEGCSYEHIEEELDRFLEKVIELA